MCALQLSPSRSEKTHSFAPPVAMLAWVVALLLCFQGRSWDRIRPYMGLLDVGHSRIVLFLCGVHAGAYVRSVARQAWTHYLQSCERNLRLSRFAHDHMVFGLLYNLFLVAFHNESSAVCLFTKHRLLDSIVSVVKASLAPPVVSTAAATLLPGKMDSSCRQTNHHDHDHPDHSHSRPPPRHVTGHRRRHHHGHRLW